jgi:hypothetical protein
MAKFIIKSAIELEYLKKLKALGLEDPRANNKQT